jgi:hypothetical protein
MPFALVVTRPANPFVMGRTGEVAWPLRCLPRKKMKRPTSAGARPREILPFAMGLTVHLGMIRWARKLPELFASIACMAFGICP